MTTFQHRLLTALAALALLAALAGVGLGQHNQGLRAQALQQQQYVQQSVQLEGLYREMVRALAELSARQGDEPLRTLLQRHGITYNAAPVPTAAATGPAAPRK